MKTKLIKREFTKAGFDYRQIERDGNVCIYEQVKPGVKAYEVVVLQVGPPHPMDKDPFDGLIERMPSPEMWGTRGWTHCDEASARARFDRMTQLS
jgi:hypothetical protein